MQIITMQPSKSQLDIFYKSKTTNKRYMKQKLASLILLLCVGLSAAHAYDFSAVAPTGQTLYYNIVSGNAQLTTQNSSYPYYSTKPTGDLTIPSTVTYSGITYSVTAIEGRAFVGCNKLSSVTIPNTIISIEMEAFYGCGRLTTLTIPNSVISIGGNAFAECGLTTLTIPNSVTSIGGNAFSGCCDLVSIVVSSGNTVYDSRNNCNAIIHTATNTLISGCQNTTIPNSVTMVGNLAFNRINITSVAIPNSVVSLGYSAFKDCSGLTSVTIGNSVTSIGEYAFCGCSDLAFVTIGNSLTMIGGSAFGGCTSLNHISVLNETPPTIGENAFSSVPNSCTIAVPCNRDSIYSASAWGTLFSNIVAGCHYYDFSAIAPSGDTLYYKINSDLQTVSVVAPDSDSWVSHFMPIDTLIIPETVSYGGNIYTVTVIGSSCFSDCNNITSVFIPGTVTTIEPGAFYGCSGLVNVNIPNSVTTIGGYTFFGCESLVAVVVPDAVTEIEEATFRYCSSLTSVTLGDSITSIGNGAFGDCTSLESMAIPNFVNSIGIGAFGDCSSLISITIPVSVTSIGDYAFNGCTSLASVIIPDSVTTISNGLFSFCTGLTSVTIGKSVSYIGEYSFFNCGGLNHITILNENPPTLPPTMYFAFEGVSRNCLITVPCQTDAMYRARSWGILFRNIVADTNCPGIDNCLIDMDDLPYTDNFDSYTSSTTAKTGVQPPCWTLAHQDVNMTDAYKPMIYYNASNAHSGSYALILNKRGIYAMPKFNGDVSMLQLSFYLKQTQSKYQLQVGVMTNFNDASTFTSVATFNNASTTASVLRTVDFSSYTGNGQYIAFRNILASGQTGDFSLNYIDDLTLTVRPQQCGIAIADLPYTDNFDSYTTSTTAKTGVQPPCWTLAHQDVNMTDAYKPMIYYEASNAHSGSYSLILNKRGIYAMPEFEGDVNTLQLSFYLKQTQAKYQLQVGVISDLADASTFVPLATFNNTSTTASVLRTVDFSSYTGTGHYIAFRNILASGQTGDYSLNYIDDLTLSLNCGINVADLPYTDNFDSYTSSTTAKTGVQPSCWTLAKQDVVMADEYKPMIYYNASNAHSGSYTLILNKRGIYAMPEFGGDVNTLQLSFYLKQTQTKYRLQVGVMTDLADASTFVPVVTFNNTSTTANVLRTVDFSTYSGNGHYIAFRNILASGQTGDYSINYIDDLTLDVRPQQCGIDIADLPYTDNFDSYTTATTAKTGVAPDCWTLAHQDVAMTDEYKPMVYYNAANAHSGSYSLILNKRGIYAMPEYTGDFSSLQLQFYLKQPQAKYRLQVGVMTDLSNASTFVPIATFNNTSTTTSVLRTVNFASYTGNGHYIVFRNTLAAGQTGDYSCNYIDDLTLSMVGAKGAMPVDNHDVLGHHEMIVYPNPTSGMLTVEADEEVERVEVYDFTGRCVATFERQATIDLSRLSTGIYTLRVTLPERIEVRRVVKQ